MKQFQAISGWIGIVLSLVHVNLARADGPEGPNWNPSWHIQTSPIGDLANRLNLQFSHFFSPQFAMGIKGTRIRNGSQALFGNDNGSEIGVRGSYYWASDDDSLVRVGGHVGVFRADFNRGDSIDDAVGAVFQSPTFDRDEIDGPMFEFVAGPLVHWNSWLTTEGLGGFQVYQLAYYTYNRSDASRIQRQPSAWKVYPVLELNLGVAF